MKGYLPVAPTATKFARRKEFGVASEAARRIGRPRRIGGSLTVFGTPDTQAA